MHTQRPRLWLSISFVSALAAAAASAAGLGAGASSAVLGQPLDFAVQVRLEPGDSLAPECVSAEVTSGDRRVPPPLVRTVVEVTGADSARVRVLTQTSIDEPVLSIQLTVGCTSRMVRRYVVLADPPIIAAAPLASAIAAAPSAVPAAAPDTATQGGSNSTPPTPASTPPQTSVQGLSHTSTATVQSRPAPALDPAQAARLAERRAARAAARAASRAAARAAAAKRPRAQAAAAAPGIAKEQPRLKLDAAEPPPSAEADAVERAMAAVAQAASATQAAASAASASAERITSLERTVEALRSEAKSSRDFAAELKQRLTQTEGSSAWMLPLMVVAGLLAALAAWLAWRLGRAQTAMQQGWREAAHARPAAETLDPSPSRQPTAPVPFVTTQLKPAGAASSGSSQAAARGRTAPAWPPPAPPVAWPPANSTLPPDLPAETQVPAELNERTEPLPAHLRSDDGAPRDVSIEELIDLEQQAEFFVVLGQDEAAIDLLAEHLRSTGGGSPLPYLKLLEIHRRRNDHEAYERMRSRFNQRFNAYAPEWGVDLGHGRALDDYAGVIPRLQQVWPRPLDAMAELEALLFRKSRGELFDLPAYREVLFLYSLARDLMDRSAVDTGNVDLLLPIADGSEFGSTAPSPYLGLERDAFRDTQVPDDKPTGPVDFDVSAAERATSIFDLLDEKTQPFPGPRPP